MLLGSHGERYCLSDQTARTLLSCSCRGGGPSICSVYTDRPRGTENPRAGLLGKPLPPHTQRSCCPSTKETQQASGALERVTPQDGPPLLLGKGQRHLDVDHEGLRWGLPASWPALSMLLSLVGAAEGGGLSKRQMGSYHPQSRSLRGSPSPSWPLVPAAPLRPRLISTHSPSTISVHPPVSLPRATDNRGWERLHPLIWAGKTVICDCWWLSLVLPVSPVISKVHFFLFCFHGYHSGVLPTTPLSLPGFLPHRLSFLSDSSSTLLPF